MLGSMNTNCLFYLLISVNIRNKHFSQYQIVKPAQTKVYSDARKLN
jgi:hypothetical protein